MTKTRFFYLRDSHNAPVACVASQLAGSNVDFALSVWNPIDIFNRDRAKQIAEARLVSGKVKSVEFVRETIKQRIMGAILEDTATPTRARIAAKLWLRARRNRERAEGN